MQNMRSCKLWVTMSVLLVCPEVATSYYVFYANYLFACQHYVVHHAWLKLQVPLSLTIATLLQQPPTQSVNIHNYMI